MDSGEASRESSLLYQYSNSQIPFFRSQLNELSHILPASAAVGLPGILFIGLQSSGKTSVLESITGKVKLPTGNEKIVTRCPLQLEFHPLAPGQKEEARLHYKQSDSTPVTSKVLALHDIAREVAAAQDELAGTQYGVVNKLIRLETFIEDSPELTLIDLPGHTISPIGDQKETIGEEILTMWRLHMAGPEKVIVCVMQATNDSSTHQAVKLVGENDPSGSRTLVTVTKLDRKEEADLTPFINSIDGIVKHQGIALVRNKGPTEDASFSSQKAEKELFEKHPELVEMRTEPPLLLGVKALNQKLVELQGQMMWRSLPQVMTMVRSELRKVEDQLNALPPVVETAEEAVERAKTELFRLAEQFCSVELSNKEQLDQELELSKMPEMELNRLFKEHSKRFIQQIIDGFGGCEKLLSLEVAQKVQKELASRVGLYLPGHYQPGAIISLYNDLVHSKLQTPSLQLRSSVFRLVENCLTTIIKKLVQSEGVQQIAIAEMLDILSNQAHMLDEHVNRLIDHTKDWVNTFNEGRYLRKKERLQKGLTSFADRLKEFTGAERRGDIASAVAELVIPAQFQKIGNFTVDLLKLLAKRSEGTEEDKAVLDVQLSLAAITPIILERLNDEIPAGCRLLLVTQVRKLLQKSKLCSALDKHKEEVFIAMQNNNLLARKKALTAQKQQLEDWLSRWTHIRAEE
ncbi:TPA: hypothetical protein ACH3X2_007415 [Trebouxia sp. C0005]